MKKLYFILSLILLIAGCRENPPAQPDGSCELIIKAWYPNPDSLASVKYLPAADAKVILRSEYGTIIKNTDADGILHLYNLPSAVYKYSVMLNHPLLEDFYFTANSVELNVRPGLINRDTLYTEPVKIGGICINEIYISGPVNGKYYFLDQFIELYNSSDKVKYLDGILVLRFSGNGKPNKGSGANEGDDGDIDGVTNIYKFPGEPGGKKYPFYPNSFLTIAASAMDYTKFFSSSFDLTKADWELYNSMALNDTDDPNVPNLLNVRTDQTGSPLFETVNGIIVIANGKDIVYQNGIDISSVLDGVQYSLKGSLNPETIDNRVDKSYMFCPAQNSGKSMQRKKPGLDSDDAAMDWEILDKPTPGRQ